MKIITNKLAYLKEKCSGKTVLDIGCVEHEYKNTKYPEWVHKNIKSVAKEVVGLDNASDLISKLNSEGYHIIDADAQNFDLIKEYPNGFDVIVAGEIIEHLPNPGQFMETMKKHLAKDGFIIITTPNAFSFTAFLEAFVSGNDCMNDDHTFVFSKKNMDKFLEKCGFKIIDFHFENYRYKHHQKLFSKIIVWPLAFLQKIVSWMRPSFSRGLIYVVQPKD